MMGCLEKDGSMEAKRQRVEPELIFPSMQPQQEKYVDRLVRDGDIMTYEKEEEDEEGRKQKILVDEYISVLKAKLLKHKKNLPDDFFNLCQYDYDGNTMLRFDELNYSWDVLPLPSLLPGRLREHAISYQDHVWESNRSGFIRFDSHENAKKFLLMYNGLNIGGTEITYKLSWAPFVVYDYDEAEENLEGTWITAPRLSRKESVEKQEQYKALGSAIENFHKELASIHVKDNDIWPFRKFTYPEVIIADGPTHILYLHRVDPNVTEDDMKRIFEIYGDCSVSLVEGKGIGFVEFIHGEHASKAFENLFARLEVENICDLLWGRKTRIEATV